MASDHQTPKSGPVGGITRGKGKEGMMIVIKIMEED